MKRSQLSFILISLWLLLSGNASAQSVFKLERVANPSTSYKSYTGNINYTFDIPNNWSEYPWGEYKALAPPGAYFVGESANLTHGVTFGTVPFKNSLEQTTRLLIDSVSTSNPHLREKPGFQTTRISGRDALVSTSQGKFPFTGLNEIIVLYTTVMPNGEVFHISTDIPEVDFDKYQAVFTKIISSIKFPTRSAVRRIDDRSWNITLDARENWYDTGIPVSEGSKLNISARGMIVWNPGEATSTATPAGVGYSPADLSNADGFPAINARCGSLVMKIGQTVYPVGATRRIDVNNSFAEETIKLMINDRVTGLGDNSGVYEISLSMASNEADTISALSVEGYADIVEIDRSSCQLRVISGTKIYEGKVAYARLSDLVGRRILGFEDALSTLSGKQIRIVFVNPATPAGTSIFYFGDIRRLSISRNQNDSEWNQKTTSNETIIDLSSDILFDFGKSDLKPEAIPALIKLARLIRQSDTQKILLNGFTDSIGSDAYNLALSERRAASVKRWLVNTGGVVPKRLQTHGYGESDPIEPNTLPDGEDNPLGRQRNRRVEIRIPRN